MIINKSSCVVRQANGSAIGTLCRMALRYTGYFVFALFALLPFVSNSHNALAFVVTAPFVAVVSYAVAQKNSLSFTILFCLGVSFWTDFLIHYVYVSLDIRIKVICLIPAVSCCLRSGVQTKRVRIATFALLFGSAINIVAALSESSLLIENYVYSFTPLFILTLFSMEDDASELKHVYTYIYCVSLFLTSIQSLANFNVDTRNGLFGVYGQAGYYLFALLAPLYVLTRYIYGYDKINKVIILTASSSYIYLMTEAKSFIFILIALEICCFIISRRASIKNVFMVCLLFLCFPIALSLIVAIHPKFEFLDISVILSTLLDEQARSGFMFTRFESLQIIVSNIDLPRLIVGSGMGSYSIPDNMLMVAHGLVENMPQYMNHYGFYHGYVQSTVSVALLEGGIILIACIAVIWLGNIAQLLRGIQSNNKYACMGLLLLAMHLAILYQLIYSNLFNYNSILLLSIIQILINNYLTLCKNSCYSERWPR
ncbi:hypothetical protein [Collinsella sp. An271]|uniref:hypothetical protein n=1 Tax=Collinsella sp. An271 TaxID=1965616 RepID=UPI001302A35D|nr:hypothetical protein [Collinsella sp. An271]